LGWWVTLHSAFRL
jgi:NADPH:quinone reductase-like Zn-dependent oxidoreductase